MLEPTFSPPEPDVKVPEIVEPIIYDTDRSKSLLKLMSTTYVRISQDDVADPAIDLNTTDEQGNTFLILATKRSCTDLVRFLVTKLQTASLNHQDMDGNTALHYAAMKADLSIVQLLAGAGMNVNLENRAGNTPLLEAALSRNGAVFAYLLNHKSVQTTTTNLRGLTLEKIVDLIPELVPYYDKWRELSKSKRTAHQ